MDGITGAMEVLALVVLAMEDLASEDLVIRIGDLTTSVMEDLDIVAMDGAGIVGIDGTILDLVALDLEDSATVMLGTLVTTDMDLLIEVSMEIEDLRSTLEDAVITTIEQLPAILLGQHLVEADLI